MVAYTLARALADEGLPQPSFVAVGACPPPDAPPALMGAAEFPDRELVGLLTDLGALPPGTSRDPGGLWYRSALPVRRDDLRLAAALRRAADDPSTGGPLPVPVLAFCGSEDVVVRPATAGGWCRWTAARFVCRTVSGGHFFERGQELPRLLDRACRVAHRAALPV